MLLHGASPATSASGTFRRFPLWVLAGGEFAGLLLKPGCSQEAEGLYPTAQCQERKDRTPAWKSDAERKKTLN